MEYLGWAIVIMIMSGAAAWVMRDKPDICAPIGAGGCLAACGIGLLGAGRALVLSKLESQTLAWNVPFGSFGLRLDLLAAVFLLPVFLVGAMTAMAALRRAPGTYAANRPGEHWLFHNLTLAGAAGVVLARNSVLLLFAWETMTVASFLLIENDQREPGSRSGGWVYLTAGHLGAACLFALFSLMGSTDVRLDFMTSGTAGAATTAMFILALVGFGGKTGLFPFHAWYTESYPPSPAHVGALLSGVVGNMGIYGLARVIYLLGSGTPPPMWWGYLLLFCGLGSALVGAARSLASGDIARLLAWSSVENFGLMSAGLGLGLVGAGRGDGMVSFLGFAAALFHMLNHSVSKALLFLAAGDVSQRSGTRAIGRMGGMLKRLPLTGVLFLAGALGAASVPPANGFASELLLLMSAFTGVATFGSEVPIDVFLMVLTLAVIALAGGMAVAAYVKAFGFIFLGAPRGPGAVAEGRERRLFLVPHLVLACVAVLIALASPVVLSLLRPAASVLTRVWFHGGPDAAGLEARLGAGGATPLASACIGAWLLGLGVAAAFLIRRFLLRGKTVASGPTWDCGYVLPDSRMQYTPSSFARPLAETFQVAVTLEDRETHSRGAFPETASFASSTPGVERAWGYSQIFNLVARASEKVRLMQTGRVQMYLLYMAAVLIILLLWKL